MGIIFIEKLLYSNNGSVCRRKQRCQKVSGSEMLPLAGGEAVNEGYVTIKCYRCGSTMQLVIGSIRSDLLLCPVCHEGEIECRAQQPGNIDYEILISRLQDLGQYIATPVQLSLN